MGPLVILVGILWGLSLSSYADTCCTHITSMAKGTSSVEPAGGAKKATTARLKAPESRVDGKVGITML
jgi:hypothetical protein